MRDDGAFSGLIGRVAEAIVTPALGAPNKHLSTKSEIRWGQNGSFSVDLKKDVWNDHEEQIGGGVLDLIKSFKGMEKPEAIKWLEENGLIEPRRKSGGENFFGPSPDQPVAADIPEFIDPKPIAAFDYHDADGNLAYQVLKFPKTAARRYMQRRPYKDGWIWGLQAGEYGRRRGDKHFWKAKEDKTYDEVVTVDDAERFLYRREDVAREKANAGLVILNEGEKDAETVFSFGVTATTNAGGAKFWQASFDDELAGLTVIIMPDNDEAGYNRAQARAAGLKAKGCQVRILSIAEHWPDCPEKGDVSDWRAAGGTASEFKALIAKAKPWSPTPPKSLFGAITWDRMEEDAMEMEFLVDDMLTIGDKSVMAGASGSGKTFLTLHLCMAVARGTEFLGRQVNKGAVIYQAGEGARGLKKRIRAYKTHFDIPNDEDVPFVMLPAKVDLFNRDGDTQKFIDEIKAWQLVLPEKLQLIVIDTFSRATAGANENDGKDVSQFLDHIDRVQKETGAHVLIVHHMNAEGRKMRGHTSLYADVDQVLTIAKDENTGIRTIALTKQKDGEDGVKIQFSLAQVKIGFNPKTEKDITSCVVLSVSEKEKLKKEQETRGISVNPTERRFLMDFFEAVEKYGQFVADERDFNPSLPPSSRGKNVVSYSNFVEVALSNMLNEEDAGRAKDRIRKSFNRMTDGLRKYGVLEFNKPYMWWTGKPIRGFPKTFPSYAPLDPTPQPHHVYEGRFPDDDDDDLSLR